jgi:diguanylate cyclase (GGDEF)-like protein
MALLFIQFGLLVLMVMIMLLVLIVDQAERRAEYVGLILGLTAILLVAIRFNLTARYNASAWITMIGMSIGPWASILLDPKILQGDIIPLVYIVISIHLCATFLYELPTAIIASVQLTAVIVLISFNPNYANVNWPSFCAYIVCASLISIIISFNNHKHIEQIEAQNKALLANKEQLLFLSTRDSLTGLFNRRYMEDTLEREIAQAIRKNYVLALVMMDIDNFKEINDKFGHMAGDIVLSRIAEILKQSVRQSDVVCRFGGDEYIIIIPGCSVTMVESRTSKMLDNLKFETFECTGSNIFHVTMSSGIASLPENGMTADELLRAADTSLYKAKEHKPKGNQEARPKAEEKAGR